MTAKTRIVIITLCCAIALALTFTCAVIFSGSFRDKITGESETTAEPLVTNPAVVWNMIDRPETVYGVWITAGTDFEYVGKTAAEVADSINAVVGRAAELGINTLFFDCLSNSEPIIINDADGSSLNILESCVESAHSNNIYAVIALNPDGDPLTAAETAYDTAIRKMVDVTNFDAVMLTGLWADGNDLTGKLRSCTAAVRSVLDELIKPVEIIIQVPFDLSGDDGDYGAAAVELLKSSTTDTVCLSPYAGETDMSEEEFEKHLNGVCDVFKDCDGDFILGYDISRSVEELSYAEVCVKEFNFASGLNKNIGLALSPISVFLDNTDNENINLIKNYLLGTVDVAVFFKEFTMKNYESTDITVDESKVVFNGGCSPQYPLTCNGEAVECNDSGDFAVSYPVESGVNTFTFEHNGQKYVYTVTYKVDLIKSVSPKSESSVMGDSDVQISAVALKGATVTAKLNGSTITMKEGAYLSDDEGNSNLDEDSDYTYYVGSYRVPAATSKVQSVGSFSVTANYNGLSETVKGGTIKVAKKIVLELVTEEATTKPVTTKVTTTKEVITSQTTTNEPESYTDEDGITHYVTTNESDKTTVTTTSTGYSKWGQTTNTESTTLSSTKKLTPYSSNGISGTATMCEVTDDYAEAVFNQKSGNEDYRYVPVCTPLPKGTFDYIIAEPSKDGSYYYSLNSGLCINREDVKVIEAGHMMPANHISSSCKVSGTDLIITVVPRWKVPFTAKVTGQSYTSSNDGRPYAVKSFSATGLEITFHYTTVATGNFNLSSSTVIGSSQWSVSNDTATLKLSFRQAGKYYGYSATYDSNDNLIITIKGKPSSSLSGYTIMLDPGHGGATEQNTECAASSTKYKNEEDLNLAIALKVKKKLEAEGANVIMTRSTDTFISVENRADLARSKKPDMFLSIHCDAAGPSAMGTSAFYFHACSYSFADAIHDSLVSAYKNEIYSKSKYAASYSSISSKIDRGTRFSSQYCVTRIETCPSALVEYGFATNATECAELVSDTSQNILAAATVTGIKNYIKQ